MFSNRKLYNMDPKVYNDGDVDKRKLIKNQIDISCLTHLIFVPSFEFSFWKIEHIPETSMYILQKHTAKFSRLSDSRSNTGSHCCISSSVWQIITAANEGTVQCKSQ